MAAQRARTDRGPGTGWRAQLGLCPLGRTGNFGILEEVLSLLGTNITPTAWTGLTPGIAPTTAGWLGVAPTTKAWPGVAPTTKAWPGIAPTITACPGFAPTTKGWPGFAQQPYWSPTPGGGVAKQYPTGQVGIPYAYHPGYGLVQ